MNSMQRAWRRSNLEQLHALLSCIRAINRAQRMPIVAASTMISDALTNAKCCLEDALEDDQTLDVIIEITEDAIRQPAEEDLKGETHD